MRKIARSDINRLELTLLRGDPLLALIRDVSRMARRGARARRQRRAIPPESDNVFWLREQFEQNALPRDPLLVRALLDTAKDDPELVRRLVSEAKDERGRDMFTRERDVPATEAGNG